MRGTIGLLASLTLVFGVAGTASAGHEVDSVSMDPISVAGCGTQSVTVTGQATFSAPVQHLVVSVDGSVLFDNHSEPATWSTGPLTLGVGSHTVTASIYDSMEGDGHEDLLAQATKTFTVPECASPAPGGGAASGASAGSDDCCPGPDPVTAKPAVKGATKTKIKAAATMEQGLPASLRWVNETFRKVHGRDPSFKEWEYWANRYLSGKTPYSALYGAMQWHKLRGHTTDR